MVEFNKMFVMLPVMLAARKLDGEDPMTLFYVRVAYGLIQSIAILIVLYTYRVVSTSISDDGIVYIPPAPAPFADPNAKKKYLEIRFKTHCISTARSLVGSTLFGIVLTVGFHYYKGMVMGLAIQTVMAPFSLIENPLVKALLWSSSRKITTQDKIFGEKLLSEIDPNDEIVDEHGNQVVRSTRIQQQNGNNTTAATLVNQQLTMTNVIPNNESKQQTIEEIILDTWDGGAKADVSLLLNVLTKDNINTTTQEDKWTSLMILSGLGAAPGTASAIRHVLGLGADVTMTDVEGWNCYHWAGFHGSIIAAKELLSLTDSVPQLLSVKDKEGNTPAETARKEGNTAVADLYEAALLSAKNDTKKDK